MGHTDISMTKDVYYFNRQSAQKKREEISKVISF